MVRSQKPPPWVEPKEPVAALSRRNMNKLYGFEGEVTKMLCCRKVVYLPQPGPNGPVRFCFFVLQVLSPSSKKLGV